MISILVTYIITFILCLATGKSLYAVLKDLLKNRQSYLIRSTLPVDYVPTVDDVIQFHRIPKYNRKEYYSDTGVIINIHEDDKGFKVYQVDCDTKWGKKTHYVHKNQMTAYFCNVMEAATVPEELSRI